MRLAFGRTLAVRAPAQCLQRRTEQRIGERAGHARARNRHERIRTQQQRDRADRERTRELGERSGRRDAAR